MKSRMPSTQVSRGTRYHSVEALARKDGITEGGCEAAALFTADEMGSRPAALIKGATMKAANPKGWKGWKPADIARTVPNFSIDEDGFAWA